MIRTIAAVAMLALGIASIVGVAHLRIDNSLERWVGDDGRAGATYAEFRETFGSDEFVVVALLDADPFDPERLDAQLDAVERLEAVPGVVRVRGLATVFRDRFGAEDPDALRDEATSTPFYEGLFLSRDHGDAGILVEVDPPPHAHARHALMRGIRQACAGLEVDGARVSFVGSTVLSAALDRVSRTEAHRTLPVALLLSLVVLGVLLRSFRAMVVAAACAGLSVVLALGGMAAAGRPFDMVSTVIPPLLWVLAMSNAVHILRRYQDHRARLPVREALRAALDETTRPCTLAALTTAAGFASLATASVQPVRETGVAAAAGILVSLAVQLTVVPALIVLLRVPAPRTTSALGFDRLVPSSRRAAAATLVGAGLLVGLVVAGIPWIRVESNPLHFLPRDGETVRAYREVGQRLTGFYTLEAVLTLPGEWWSRPVTATIDRVAQSLAASPIVAKVVSPVDVLRKLAHWRERFDPESYRLPASTAEAATLLDGLDDDGRDILRGLVDPTGRTVRLSAVVREMNQDRFLDLVDATGRELERLPAGYRGSLTGMVLQLVSAQHDLVRTQLRSLAFAVALVFACVALGLRSARLAAVAIVPNVLPITVSFGLMAALRIPLDTGTVMVASIALGIAVDDAVHFLEGYRRRRSSGDDVQTALHAALGQVGPAMLVTTAAACAGFFSLAGSGFAPIRYFGLLSGVAMIVALMAAIGVLPAMLSVRRRTS